MSKVKEEVKTFGTQVVKEGGKKAKHDREARMKALREKSQAKKARNTLPPIKRGQGAGFTEEILQ